MRFWTDSRRQILVLAAAVCMLASACVSTVDDDYFTSGIDTGSPEEPATEQTDSEQTASGETVADDTAEGDLDSGSDSDSEPVELAVGAVADPAGLASIEAVACSFDEPVPLPVTPSCYAVSVPEDWNNPDPGDQVILQAAVFEGSGEVDDPIIYFDGGPGGHTLDALSLTYTGLVEPFLGDRDYIVFDQRGLGLSEPVLSCPESVEVAFADFAGTIAPESLAEVSLEAQNECRDRLVGSGVNLEAYNSIASANDIEAMRSLLGYEQLNIISISYGTRLAQSYMRMYPESVRSVVLDSVFPTASDLWSNFDPGAIRAFEQLFDGCAASVSCNQTYPDLEDRFFELLDRLDAEPLTFDAQNLLTGAAVPVVLDGDDVMSLVFSALYDRGQFAAVPQMVEQGLAGDYQTIELFTSIQVTNIEFVSYGMRLSVECNEEIPFESRAVLEANRPTGPPYDRLADIDGDLTLFDLCEQWPAGTAPEIESETVTSDLPTLVLAGQYDPITPPAGADVVSAGLSNSYSLLLPHEGHGIAPTDCGSELVNAFITEPTVEPDSSCIATSDEPQWVPGGDGAPIELIEFEVSGLVSITGLRPAEWIDVGNGVFGRSQTAVDPTTLIVQPTGGLAADVLIGLIGDQLGVSLVETGPAEIGGAAWNQYSSADGADQAVRAAFRTEGAGVVVMLVASNEEIDSLYDEIFLEVAAAANPG